MSLPRNNLTKHFSTIKDPRIPRGKKHPLINIFFISVTGMICGCDTWVEIEEFGNSQKDYLSKYLDLTNGIPSHDTFGRVFALIDMDEFQKVFLSWTSDICNSTKGKVIAFDGKTVRRSGDSIKEHRAIHMVSAWVVDNHVVLAQNKVKDKTNEIKALEELFKILDLEESIITIDAIGCQRKIVEILADKKADYVIALKANQKTLRKEVDNIFSSINERGEACTYSLEGEYTTSEKNRNRVEQRTYSLVTDIEDIEFLNTGNRWKNLRGIVQVESQRQINQVKTKETRYYITSLTDISTISNAVRSHWGVENNLHRTLDVSFREDESRARRGNSATNLSTIRRIALNLINQNTDEGSINVKRKRAGFNEEFRDKLLFQ